MKKLFIKQMYSTEQYKNLISIADLPPIRIKAESLFTNTLEKKNVFIGLKRVNGLLLVILFYSRLFQIL